jgi:NADPH:quinone reductase-like Zn-dependent oxidoreductase
MTRILVRVPGGHEALELVSEPDPVPGEGQVRVRVRAAGVNFADTVVRLGYYDAAKGKYPITPGFEFAGVVDAVGPGAKRFAPGQRVLGFTLFGGYTDCIAISERQLSACPEGWDFGECAAIPGVFFTAYHALFKVAKVEAGETLLIHSAAGGVGTALLQLSRIAGCRPIGVVGSEHKVALCKELGADAVIVRGKDDLWAEADRLAPQGFDAIFDASGVSTLRDGFKRLAHGGRLVSYGFADILPRGKDRIHLWDMAWNYLRVPRFSPLEMTTTNRSVMGFNVAFLFHKMGLAEKAMEDILGWVREGKIRKVPVTSFPLEKAADAHRAIESGTTTGKLVLTT